MLNEFNDSGLYTANVSGSRNKYSKIFQFVFSMNWLSIKRLSR